MATVVEGEYPIIPRFANMGTDSPPVITVPVGGRASKTAAGIVNRCAAAGAVQTKAPMRACVPSFVPESPTILTKPSGSSVPVHVTAQSCERLIAPMLPRLDNDGRSRSTCTPKGPTSGPPAPFIKVNALLPGGINMRELSGKVPVSMLKYPPLLNRSDWSVKLRHAKKWTGVQVLCRGGRNGHG
jgi:hypothetical protein